VRGPRGNRHAGGQGPSWPGDFSRLSVSAAEGRASAATRQGIRPTRGGRGRFDALMQCFAVQSGGCERTVHMRPEQRRELIRQARERPAPLTLVIASLVSAGAAIAGLDVWVAIAAAAVAVLSAAQVMRTEVVVPARTRRTMRAAVPIRVSRDSDEPILSTAVPSPVSGVDVGGRAPARSMNFWARLISSGRQAGGFLVARCDRRPSRSRGPLTADCDSDLGGVGDQ
jgi:hypothetical protein